MNMVQIIKKLTIIVFIFGVISCSEDIKPTVYNYSQVFTGKTKKTWVIDRLVQRQDGKSDQNLSLDACGKDDQYIFYANDEKLYEVNNANSVCGGDDSDPILVSYTWSFNNANASLTMVMPHVFGNFLIPFTVLKATKDEMDLEVFLDQQNTVSYVVILKSSGEN
jgi:hypothetical protein